MYYLRSDLAVIESFFLFLCRESVVKQQPEQIHIVVINSLSHPKKNPKYKTPKKSKIMRWCELASGHVDCW